jgi:myo-inositol-1(or 4)-monophosphatase
MSGTGPDRDLESLLAVALGAARAGGDVVLAAFGSAREVRAKAPGDWVSATDTASERIVRAALLDGAPDIPVHGEEEGGKRAAVEWLVDPLDGTANFLHQFPVVGVSIALVVDGRPAVGVVHAPMLGNT